MPKNEALGKQGEDLAANYLEQNGIKILGRNQRFAGVEVDLLAEEGEEIVVVEVKTRGSKLVHPSLAVDQKKQKRLARAAQAIALEYPAHSLRFDVICLIMQNNACTIEHYRDAFRPELSFGDSSFE